MLDLLFSEVVITGFWLSFLAALIIFLLQLLFSKPGSHDSSRRAPVTFQQLNQITQQTVFINHTHKSKKVNSSASNKNDAGAYLGLLVLAGVLYQKYEALLIQAMVGVIVFVSTLWLFTILLAYRRRVIHGPEWQQFLAATLFFVGASLYLVHSSLEPFYTVQVATRPVLAGLQGILEASYKFIGLALVFGGLIAIFGTLVHYIAQINIIYSYSPSPLALRLLRMTRIFSRPYVTGAVLTIAFVAAFGFTSGYFYHVVAT